ncbi:MAG: (4Fe-4S)-binding protein [Desulfuromonas sp.]|nr:MAG: (4Fe-4S)-binding protein [Desulfuromonas sp.]
MKIRVAINQVPDYSRDNISRAIRNQIDLLGGMAGFVKPGQTVLVKPNMLAGKSPEKAVTTHPEVVRAVIEEVLRAGGKVLVGDSPGIGKSDQVARKCGIMQVIEETGATFTPFIESVLVPGKNGIFQHLEIAKEVLAADVIINLPKLKTHQMMGLTCGIKNMFGAVVGMRKIRLHLQAGTNKEFFATMLLELAEFLNPALTLVDGITAMQGDGPGSGDPVQVGVLIASPSMQAVDTVACNLLNLPDSSVWTQKVALASQRPGCRMEEIALVGEPIEGLRPQQFKPAKSTDVNFSLPAFLRKPLKKSITARPEPDHNLCVRCGECVKSCPPRAMRITHNRLEIDFATCIRCFCCQELCPHGALETRQGLLLRLSRLFIKS